MPNPTEWIQLNEAPNDQWVLPIWTEANLAIKRGAVRPIPPAMSELALHVTTRLNIVPMAWKAASDKSTALITDATRRARVENIFRPGQPAYALSMSMTPAYEFILCIDSALFETHAAS